MATPANSSRSGKGKGWRSVWIGVTILTGSMVSLYWGSFPAKLEGASVVSPRGTLLPAIPGMHRVPEDQPTIQAAIDAALPGETVVVAPGFWDERIWIRDKAITLRGVAGTDRTTLSGTGSSGPVITVEGARSRGTRIEGFTVSGGHGEDGHGNSCANRLGNFRGGAFGLFAPPGKHEPCGRDDEEPQPLIGHEGCHGVRPRDRGRRHRPRIDQNVRRHGGEREHDELGQCDGDIHADHHPDAWFAQGQPRDPLDK